MQKFVLPTVFIISLAMSDVSAQIAADLVITNAKIYTANDAQPFAQAVATKADTIIYVGNENGVLPHIGPSTEVWDVQGKLILPGFHDVHLHPLEASSPAGASCFLNSQQMNPEVLGLSLIHI